MKRFSILALAALSLVVIFCDKVEPTDDPDGAAGDADGDSDGDADGDSDGDTDADTDSVTDTEAACADYGGQCTVYMWDTCPSGYEPLSLELTLDCDWYCCVPAPSGYSCNEDTWANCIPADECLGCWGTPNPPLECEPGRTCCVWYCE